MQELVCVQVPFPHEAGGRLEPGVLHILGDYLNTGLKVIREAFAASPPPAISCKECLSHLTPGEGFPDVRSQAEGSIYSLDLGA